MRTVIYYFIRLVLYSLPAVVLFASLPFSFSMPYIFVYIPLAAAALVFVGKGLIGFSQSVYRLRRHKQKMQTDINGQGVICISGPPGSGKSSDGVATIIVHAQNLWTQVRFNYLLFSSVSDYYSEMNDAVKQRDIANVIDCYKFYTAHPEYIPCLASNIPIEIDGRRSMPLTPAHVLQQSKLPPMTDIFIDESSTFLDPEIYKDNEKATVINEFFKFIRHFNGDRVLCIVCEQSRKKAYIGVRRNFDFIKKQLGQIWVNPPVFLLWLLDKLHNRYSKRVFDAAIALRLLRLDDFCRSIGFRRYRFMMVPNDEDGDVVPIDRKIYNQYISCELKFFYDSRCYSNLYICREQDIAAGHYDSLLLPASVRETYIRTRSAVNKKS